MERHVTFFIFKFFFCKRRYDFKIHLIYNNKDDRSRLERDNFNENLSGCSDQHSQRCIPSVIKSYYSTKQKCIMCGRLHVNISRLTGINNTGVCDNCSPRYDALWDSDSNLCSIV
jgi:hypothetical protein